MATRAITPTPTGPFTAPNRPSTPGSAARNAHSGATFGTHLTKSPRGLSPRPSPQPLTGAAALADERRFREQTSRQTSPNPAVAALQSLNGSVQPMSYTPDAPHDSAHANQKPDKVTKPLIIPDHANVANVTGDNMQTSPVSLSSFGDGDAPHAPGGAAVQGNSTSSSANTGREGAPKHPQQHHQHHHQLIAPNPGDNPGNRAFTFPGPLPQSRTRAPQHGR
ncbi:hypothetical protein P3342_001826 [Pyrenophora teres f. teres]|nr:hypothetical protein P3342_001826 [Pyrenophora teres f. teres]